MRVSKIVVLFVVSSFLFVFFFGVVFVCVGRLWSRIRTESISRVEKSYKYLEFDSDTREFSYGSVSIFNELGKNHFISRQKEDGTQYLISNFGSNEFYCSGKCFCDSDRRSVIPLTRSISYLVAAASSLGAVGIAKKHFNKECFREISDSCDSSAIMAEVDDCEDINEINEAKSTTLEGSESDVDVRKRRYWCSGECLVSDSLKSDIADFMAESFGCEDIKPDGEVIIKGLAEDVDDEDALLFAKERFQKEILSNMCKANSSHKYKESHTYQLIESEWKYIVLCSSGQGEHLNPTIECRRVE